jgi:catechol 2,3-dioxygenase-like lactoylglutathione lyase family enzyme
VLSASKLIGFVATSRPRESKRFYEETLGLSLIEDGPVALVFDACGTVLRLQKVKSISAPAYTVLGWEVTDIAHVVQRLSDQGVSFERYDGMPQDGFGIWTTPDGTKVAWFKDPDGNLLSFTQNAT